MNFESIPFEEAPESVRVWASQWLGEETPSAEYVDDGDFRYVLVTFGKQRSAGYLAKVNRVEAWNNEIYIEAELRRPAARLFHAQVIIHPAILIRIPREVTGDIIVKRTFRSCRSPKRNI